MQKEGVRGGGKRDAEGGSEGRREGEGGEEVDMPKTKPWLYAVECMEKHVMLIGRFQLHSSCFLP